MFDFQKLEVYKKAKALNQKLSCIYADKRVNRYYKDQLQRAVISISLNIAEGSGKFGRRDKRNFYTIARGSVYETVAILELMLDFHSISQQEYWTYYESLEEISKMLLGLIKSMGEK